MVERIKAAASPPEKLRRTTRGKSLRERKKAASGR
jgi:hypothetical protein